MNINVPILRNINNIRILNYLSPLFKSLLTVAIISYLLMCLVYFSHIGPIGNDIFQQKLVKRGVPLKNIIYEKVQSAANGTVVQELILESGLSSEKAKEVVKVIKLSKLRVQAAINGDLVRVSSKDRDILQEVIKLLKSQDFDFDIQFSNYRNQ